MGVTVLAAILLPALLFAANPPAGSKAQAVVSAAPSLDHGFQQMYNLEFGPAREEFRRWQAEHPDNPMGLTCEAAGLLFGEFHRLGVLEAQLLENDDWFHKKDRLSADEGVHQQMEALLVKAEGLAGKRLAANSGDRDALFAMTLANGLRADWTGLISKENFASLRYTRTSTQYGQRLLAVDPKFADAYLATGFAKYITGSLIAPLRWLIRLGGIDADKEGGLNDLKRTAADGRYLAPFARILLAIAYVREKNTAEAKTLLEGLRQEFPANPLFSDALKRIAEAR